MIYTTSMCLIERCDSASPNMITRIPDLAMRITTQLTLHFNGKRKTMTQTNAELWRRIMLSRTYNKLLVCFALMLIFFGCTISAYICKFNTTIYLWKMYMHIGVICTANCFCTVKKLVAYIEVEEIEARKEKQCLSQVVI